MTQAELKAERDAVEKMWRDYDAEQRKDPEVAAIFARWDERPDHEWHD